MKKIILAGAILSTIVASAQKRMGIGTNNPDASSVLEIKSGSAGLLIPRVALQATNTSTPIGNPANSLLVYNTATASAGATRVTPGYYYWDDNSSNRKWVRLATAEDVTTGGPGSVETVLAKNTMLTVTEAGGTKNKTYTVSITPAPSSKGDQYLQSSGGVVRWADVPKANDIKAGVRVVPAITVAEWDVPGTFALIQTTNAPIHLPNPAKYTGKMIAVNNQYANIVSYGSPYSPEKTSALEAGKGHILLSSGSAWYIIGGSY